MLEQMKQALERAERKLSAYVGVCAGDKELTDAVLPMVRQAIKEVKSQEPVAWSYWQSCLNDDGTQTAPWVHRLSKFKPHESVINKDVIPLYTHPPQRTEQGPMAPTGVKGYAMALNEVALKLRKRYEHDLLSTPLWAEFEKARNKLARSIATPPSQPAQRKPLTDKQIEACLHHVDEDGIGLFAFARAIEAAHGIKE